jgi:5'-deoxynucleotidase YfbR-like HD superfamily hydrolase
MKSVADLLFEANMLKSIPRSGYAFLGAGRESVAEHVYSTTFIAWVMSRLEPGADALRLVSLCLIHDLPETRIGDLNNVQKRYVTPHERLAAEQAAENLPFGFQITGLLEEFNAGHTLEAKLARDADQLAFVVELKTLSDKGYEPADKWLAYVLDRLITDTGRRMADAVMATDWDGWWLDNYVDTGRGKP